MKMVINFFAIFISTFFFLSIQLKNETIFSHFYSVTSPVTKYAQNSIENFFEASMNSTHSYSKKLFNNSVPRVRDSVKAKMSGITKPSSSPDEEISPEDKNQLEELIKSHPHN